MMRFSRAFEDRHPVRRTYAICRTQCELCRQDFAWERAWWVPTPHPLPSPAAVKRAADRAAEIEAQGLSYLLPSPIAMTWGYGGGQGGVYLCRECAPTRPHAYAWRREAFGLDVTEQDP